MNPQPRLPVSWKRPGTSAVAAQVLPYVVLVTTEVPRPRPFKLCPLLQENPYGVV